MNSPFHLAQEDTDEISLLDVLLVIVKNLRLLVMGPLLAGAAAWGICFLIPPVYESVAVQAGDALLVAMYNSAQVRDGVIEKSAYARSGEGLDVARARLAKDLKVSLNAKDKTITIASRAATPQAAQLIAQAAVEQAAVLNQGRVEDGRRLRKQFEQVSRLERDYAASAERLAQKMLSESPANQATLVQLQARLLDAAKDAQIAAANLAESMQKADSFDLLQAPTLPTRKAAPSGTLIAVIAGLATGFALMLLVFIRHALANATSDSVAGPKVLALRLAWRKSLGIS